MWKLHSTAHQVIPASICLSFTLLLVGAHAQTATDASVDKRIQVLDIRETSVAKQTLGKSSKTAATPAKKKVAHRNTGRQIKAAGMEGARGPGAQLPNPLVQTAMADVPLGAVTLPAEQTGILAVGDRENAVVLRPGEDQNFDLAGGSDAGGKADLSATVLDTGTPRHAIADVEQTVNTPRAVQVQSSSNSPLAQVLAMVSGAVIAAALGWYLIGSGSTRSRAFG